MSDTTRLLQIEVVRSLKRQNQIYQEILNYSISDETKTAITQVIQRNNLRIEEIDPDNQIRQDPIFVNQETCLITAENL